MWALDKLWIIGYTTAMLCGLCESSDIKPYSRDEKRSWDYFQCQTCDLVFRDPATYLDASTEKQRYTTHNNSIENQGYVTFLSPVVQTIIPHLSSDSRGLDFGSGPGPILDILFSRQGITVENYDPYFCKTDEALGRTYDFVTCTEVFEHLYTPGREISVMTGLIKPGGHLLIMTEMCKEPEAFKAWGYRTDNTHVCFLSPKTLLWIANRWGYEILSSLGRISLLQKKS